MTDTPGIPAERLLAHTEWVRALAVRLVRDEAHAEDLVQETWLQALKRPPRTSRNLRGWLAAILRNTARQMGRRETRRRRHEAAAGQVHGSRSTEQIEDEARLHRELVDRVLRLPEPYRQLLLLRYFEGLSPTEIGRRQGIPPSTIRSRLQRGLAELRTRLDREYGDRLRWAALFMPLARTGALPVPHVLRALPGVAAGLVGLAILAAAWSFLMPHRESPVPVSGRDVTRMSGVSAEEVTAPERTLPAPRQPATANTEDEPRHSVPLWGRVLDFEGRPVPDVLVALRGDPDAPGTGVEAGAGRAPSDPEGRFRLDLPGGEEVHRVELVVVGDDTATLGNFWRPVEREQIVVVASSRSLEGSVRDAYGGPLAEANVRVGFSIRGLHAFPLPTDESIASGRVTSRTDPAGLFALRGIPDLPGLYLSVRATGYAPESRFLPRGPLPTMDIAMEPRSYPGQPRIEGIVLSSAGEPVPRAHVSFGAVNTAVTDVAGQFSMSVHPAGPPWIYVSPPNREALQSYDLIAVATGYQPSILPGFGLRLLEQENLDHVLVRLGPRPLTLTGRVVDEEGAPCPQVQVELADPTRHVGGGSTAEQVAGGRPRLVHTDENGAFALTGLRDREYALRILDPTTTAELTAGPFYAGESALELILPRRDARPPVFGSVAGVDGRPLAGVSVAPVLPGTERRPQPGRPVFTDDEGRFTLQDLPRARRLILLRCAGYGSETVALDAGDEVIPTVVLQPVARVRILPRPEQRPVRIVAKDADGRDLMLTALRLDGSTMRARDLPLPPGETPPICEIPVAARSLLVEFQDGSKDTRSIELVPGELMTLTF